MHLHSSLLSGVILVNFFRLGQASGRIAFQSASCTDDILPFIKSEFNNAFKLNRQAAAYLQPPLFTGPIQDYVKDLFGPVRAKGPQGQENFNPVAFPRWVTSGGRPEDPNGKGLLSFGEFVSEEEDLDYNDVVRALITTRPLCLAVVRTNAELELSSWCAICGRLVRMQRSTL